MNPGSHNNWWMMGLMGFILLNGCCLTIKVDENYVRFSFGIGLFGRKYAISKITSCKPISYIALGWGIRFRKDAILYNVSGNKAVEIEVEGKVMKIWIGTDKPDEIAAYINEQRAKLRNA
jgi:hypothetical protein